MTTLPQLADCLFLEWGATFWLVTIVIIVAIVGFFILLIWFLSRRHGTSTNEAVAISHEDSGLKVKVSGPMTVGIFAALLVLLLIGCIGFVIYWVSNEFRQEHSVALNSPSRKVALEDVLEKYKHSTRVKIDIKDRAKNFLINGSYEGECISDLFQSICNQHASEISCTEDKWKQTLTIDLVSSK